MDKLVEELHLVVVACMCDLLCALWSIHTWLLQVCTCQWQRASGSPWQLQTGRLLFLRAAMFCWWQVQAASTSNILVPQNWSMIAQDDSTVSPSLPPSRLVWWHIHLTFLWNASNDELLNWPRYKCFRIIGMVCDTSMWRHGVQRWSVKRRVQTLERESKSFCKLVSCCSLSLPMLLILPTLPANERVGWLLSTLTIKKLTLVWW